MAGGARRSDRVVFVLKRPELGHAVRERFSGIYRVLVNKYYFDWFNENVVAPLARDWGAAVARGDQVVIDGAMVQCSAERWTVSPVRRGCCRADFCTRMPSG